MSSDVFVNRIAITVLVVVFSVAKAKRNDILAETAEDSWMPMNYFATVLNVSFGRSRCCNVLMHGESPGTRRLFSEFTRIYPQEYTLNNRIYDCDSYFIISKSVWELIPAVDKVPTRISTLTLLVVVADDVEESAGIFNVSMYKNANVNIVTHNGLWTLSDNFLEPRVFKKVSSHRQMEHKQGVVNLQGRELRTMAYWNPPFCYLESTINQTVKGIEGEYFIATNKSELDGVEMKLFMLVAEQLNFTWTIRNPAKNDRFGHEEGTTWTGGMLGQVMKNRVDLAFSSMWLTMAKYRHANTTQPYATLYIHFLVPRPKPYTSFWALTRPLSLEVWIAVLSMLIVQSIYVYTRALTIPEIQKRFRSFVITWTELVGRLVGSWAPKTMQGFELQFQLWHFIGILLVTAYSSSLSARLTNSHYEKRIDTLQDFVAANLTWGWEGEAPGFSTMFDLSDPYAREVVARFNNKFSDDEKHRKMLKSEYAVLGNIIGSNFFPKRTTEIEDFTEMRVMKTAIAQFQTTFVVQPWLLESVDMVILRMQDAGLVQYHLKDVLHRRTGSILREVVIEHDNYEEGPRVLQLNPLGAGFAMLLMGLSISTVVFYLEIRSVRRNVVGIQTENESINIRR